jgi:preprotein translocase subunit SecE
MALFRIYKRGQGKYSRAIGMASIGGLAVFGAFSLYEALQYGWFKSDWGVVPGFEIQLTPALVIMVAIVLFSAAGLYWANNKENMVDFLIETEGELRKVAWPGRDQVVGSAIVVVVTVLIIGFYIFFVDIILKKVMYDIIYKL